MDPDIPDYPYCRKCLDKAKILVLEKINKLAAYFLGENTIDRYCYDLILKKRKMSQTITGAADDVDEEIIDQLLNLFNQK